MVYLYIYLEEKALGCLRLQKCVKIINSSGFADFKRIKNMSFQKETGFNAFDQYLIRVFAYL